MVYLNWDDTIAMIGEVARWTEKMHCEADLYRSVFTCLLKIIIPRAPAGAGASLIPCVWHRVSRNVSGRPCGRSGASTTP